MAMSLLQTKLHAPAPPNRSGRTNHLSRPRLLQKLDAGIGQKLTLLSAPAGFGKSTLLSSWLTQKRAAGVDLADGSHRVCQAAWLSLDGGDNDPNRFWSYVVAALQSLDPTIGEASLVQLQSPQSVSHDTIVTALLNEIGARADLLILVLDDYHLIDSPTIHRALVYLLENLSPHLHIVISSRADPPLTLARWRGQGQLTELRIDDLRFDRAEAAGFLEEVMGLELAPQAIAALEGRTEGWVAGLQLAALSLQGANDRAAFITRFSGSNRYIVDYLVEEVLSRQPLAVQSFLLKSSILDQLSGPLCDAVLGVEQIGKKQNGKEQIGKKPNGMAASGQEILEELEQANLFLIPLDDERIWFRYHHLFSDVLRLRLRKTFGDEIGQLHRRASLWYEAAGQVEPAIHHALAIPDVERAAILVERVILEVMLHQGYVHSARQMIERIPFETILRRPRLTVAYGVMLALYSQYDAAEELLEKATLVRNVPEAATEVAGAFLLLRALLARIRRQFDLSIELSQQALQQLPSDDFTLRGAALQGIGTSHIRRGESAEGLRLLKEAAALTIAGNAHYLALVCYEESATEQKRRGRLAEAKRSCDEALRLAQRWGAQYLPAAGVIHVVLGEILYEWNQLDAATRSLAEGLKLITGTTEMNLLARGFVALARTQRIKGEQDAAIFTLQEGDESLDKMQLEPSSTNNAHARLALQRSFFALMDGQVVEAQQWATATQAVSDSAVLCSRHYSLIRLALALFHQDPQPSLLQEAEQLLEQSSALIEENDWLALQIEHWLLRALLCQAKRDRPAAQEALIHALALGRPEGYLRTIVDEGEALRPLLVELRLSLARKAAGEADEEFSAYVARILATLGAPIPLKEGSPSQLQPAPQALVEPLTEREIEILRLVDQGLSNSEIAAKLIVTVGTVKKHLNNIFGKLDVISRTQALANARALDLL